MTQAISVIRTDDNSKLHFLDFCHLTFSIINAAAGKKPKSLAFEEAKNFWEKRLTDGDASNSKNSSAPEKDKRSEGENNPVRRGKKYPSILKTDDVTNITRSDTNGMIYTPNETSVNNEAPNCSLCTISQNVCPLLELLRQMENNSISNLPATSVIQSDADEEESNDESESSVCTTLSNNGGDQCDSYSTIINPAGKRAEELPSITRNTFKNFIITKVGASNSKNNLPPSCVEYATSEEWRDISNKMDEVVAKKEKAKAGMEINSNSNLPATSDIEYDANEEESNHESSDCTNYNGDQWDYTDSATIQSPSFIHQTTQPQATETPLAKNGTASKAPKPESLGTKEHLTNWPRSTTAAKTRLSGRLGRYGAYLSEKWKSVKTWSKSLANELKSAK